MKFDLNADPKAIGLFGVVVFVAARAGARRVAKQSEPRPYGSFRPRYDRRGIRRPTVSGGLRNYLRETFIDVLDRGINPPPSEPIHRSRPMDPEYGTHVRTQRAIDRTHRTLDRINDRLDDVVNQRLENALRVQPDEEDKRKRTVVETKNGNPSSVELESRQEAIEVLEGLTSRIKEYEAATVGDLYDLLGVPIKHTDQDWGWTSVDDFTIEGKSLEVKLLIPPAVRL